MRRLLRLRDDETAALSSVADPRLPACPASWRLPGVSLRRGTRGRVGGCSRKAVRAERWSRWPSLVACPSCVPGARSGAQPPRPSRPIGQNSTFRGGQSDLNEYKAQSAHALDVLNECVFFAFRGSQWAESRLLMSDGDRGGVLGRRWEFRCSSDTWHLRAGGKNSKGMLASLIPGRNWASSTADGNSYGRPES